MKPRVSRAACLISMFSCAELLQRLLIISNHSPLGISMLAIAATALATYLRTTDEDDAKFANKASLIYCLNT